MVYDGDCCFCTFWIQRWQRLTGDRVEYVPFQEPSLAARFPELRREQLELAVHLVEIDGAVYNGAEAVFSAMARHARGQWLLDWYTHSPLFARAAEWIYRFIAHHRGLFSTLTRLAWGRHAEPPSHVLVRWIFLRSLGLVYLAAFLSLWVQIIGLVGERGILPAKLTMVAAREQMDAAKIGADRYHLLPTLCWLGTSDRFLKIQCAAGTLLAATLILGVAPAPCLFLLWLIYLSLATVCRDFLGFQWDNLLLETGFLATFFAPVQWLPRPSRAAPPSRLVLWLLRWLLFQLMFESGCVKWLSGDPAWRNLTALDFHYETQPLPTWIGWYAHQLPHWFQQVSTVWMFAIELGLPFLIFTPRRLRLIACVGFAVLQVFILLTGNYCFFNFLTLALCLLLLDDAMLKRCLPSKWLHAAVGQSDSYKKLLSSNSAGGLPSAVRQSRGWPRTLIVTLACISILTSLVQLSGLFRLRIPWPAPCVAVYSALSPFRTFKSYGLFAVMTTRRLEIIVEGSRDGDTWLAYEFEYKPGDVRQRPRFVAPHQPRLDWQMWFAALSDYRHNPWFVNFCVCLLQGSPDVLDLMEHNPFPNAPPRYIRALVYEYHFTDFATRRKTGAWWRRELKGSYLPEVSLSEHDETPRSSKR